MVAPVASYRRQHHHGRVKLSPLQQVTKIGENAGLRIVLRQARQRRFLVRFPLAVCHHFGIFLRMEGLDQAVIAVRLQPARVNPQAHHRDAQRF